MIAIYEAFQTFGIYKEGKFIERYYPNVNLSINEIEKELDLKYPGITIKWYNK